MPEAMLVSALSIARDGRRLPLAEVERAPRGLTTGKAEQSSEQVMARCARGDNLGRALGRCKVKVKLRFDRVLNLFVWPARDCVRTKFAPALRFWPSQAFSFSFS